MGCHHSGRRHGERGAAAVIVGAALSMLLGSLAIAVDLGERRSTQRATVSAADAAALAAAQQLNDGETEFEACAYATVIVSQNQPNATLASCATGVGASGSQTVEVTVTENIDYHFAPIIGFDSSTAAATTAARWGELGVGGVRPFALCMNWLFGIPELASWDQSGPIGPIEVDYGNGGGQANACGGAAGNWGSLDFDGGANSQQDQKDWIADGFDEPVFADTWYEGNPGAMAGWASPSLQSLVDSGETFPVPIFESVNGASGANAEFYISGFARVRLTDFKVHGKASSRTLEMVFYPEDGFPGKLCCDPSNQLIETTQQGICRVDGLDTC